MGCLGSGQGHVEYASAQQTPEPPPSRENQRRRYTRDDLSRCGGIGAWYRASYRSYAIAGVGYIGVVDGVEG